MVRLIKREKLVRIVRLTYTYSISIILRTARGIVFVLNLHITRIVRGYTYI